MKEAPPRERVKQGQNLPVGEVGGWHRLRRDRPPWQRRLRGVRWHLLMALLGLVAAGAGSLWALSEPQVDVSLSSSGYDVAGNHFSPTGPGVYQAGGASVVISVQGGRTKAAASALLNGRHMTGVCSVSGDAAEETCRFSLDSLNLTSEDRATGNGWSRVYNDGRRMGIRTTGAAPLPVPFALGR